MSKKTVNARCIYVGFPWKLRVAVRGFAAFPPEATFVSQVRRTLTDADELLTLNTANGGVVRVNATTIDLVMTAANTAALPTGNLLIDVVRTDLDEPLHLGFILTVPSRLTVTREF